MGVTSRTFGELSPRELHDILALRSAVFVVEQACLYLDIDGRDVEPGTGHHWLDDGGRIAAYARTLAEPAGETRIGRVVTHPDHRGRGRARRLMEHLVDAVAGPIVLDAQSYLVPWYETLDFVVTGPEFDDDGILHVPMRLRRGAAQSGT